MPMTFDQTKTLSLLVPNSIPSDGLIVPRGNLPEQLHAEIASGDRVKLLVAGQRGMGKTTELLRFVNSLKGSEELAIFLQFGAQDSISQSGLLYAMAEVLYSTSKAQLDNKSFKSFFDWYSAEEISTSIEEGTEGEAGLGGEYVVLSAKGKVKKSRKTAKNTKTQVVRHTQDLLDRFNSLIEKARNAKTC